MCLNFEMIVSPPSPPWNCFPPLKNFFHCAGYLAAYSCTIDFDSCKKVFKAKRPHAKKPPAKRLFSAKKCGYTLRSYHYMALCAIFGQGKDL